MKYLHIKYIIICYQDSSMNVVGSKADNFFGAGEIVTKRWILNLQLFSYLS